MNEVERGKIPQYKDNKVQKQIALNGQEDTTQKGGSFQKRKQVSLSSLYHRKILRIHI